MIQSELIDWDDPLTDDARDDPLLRGRVGWWLAGEEGPFWGGQYQNLMAPSVTPGALSSGATWRGKELSKGFGCLNFSGSTSYVTVQHNARFALTGDMTLLVSVNVTSFANYRGLIGKTNPSHAAPYDWYLDQTNGRAVFNRGNGSGSAAHQATAAPSLGVWQRVGVTMSGTTVTHYLQGAANGSGTISTTIADAGGTLLLGSRNDVFVMMLGQADDFVIANRAWTAAEFAADYAAWSASYPGIIRRVQRQQYKRRSTTAYSMPAASGAYTLTGQAAGLKRGYPLAAASGSYTLTGQAAALIRGRPMPAASGTYALTGQAAGLRAAHTLAIGSGTFTLTGQAAGLKHGYVVAATSGSYSLTGQSVTFVHGRPMAAASGSYTLTGQSVTLVHGRPMPAASGAYTLTGQAAGLKWGHKIAIVSGTYTLTGQDVTLTYSGAGAKTLAVDSGAYTLTGQAAGLRHAYKAAAASGAYALTGQTAGLKHGYTAQVAAGSYALTGQAAALRAARKLAIGSGSFVLTGQATGLAHGYKVAAASGAYTLTGQAAGLRAARSLVVASGAYAVTGQDVALSYSGSTATAAFFFQRFVVSRRG